MTPQELKNSILQLAIQGKLVEQRPEEGTGEELYCQIQAEKQRLIKAGTIKKEKPLPKIAEDEKTFEIPGSWMWVRLGEIGLTNIGLTYSPQNQSSSGTIVLRSGNVQNGQMDYSDIVRVDMDIPANKMCSAGDILICARNGSKRLVGKAAIIDQDGMSFGAFMAIYRSNCNPYIVHVIDSAYFRNELLGDTGTTTINQITQDMLRNASIPLPPLAEQKRIVAKIKELLPYIDRYEQAWSKLEDFNKRFPVDMQKSILQMAIQGKLVEQRPEEGTGEELYRQIQAEKQRLIKAGTIKKEKPMPEIAEDEIPFEIPSSWKWVQFGSVINIVSAHRVHQSDWKSNGIPFYRAREIAKLATDGYVDNELYISQSLYDDFSQSGVPHPGDLMVTAVGTLGKTYIVQDGDEFYYKDASVICLENYAHISPEYLKYIMQSELMSNQIKSNSSGTTVATLTMVRMVEYVFPLPSLAEQKRIVAKLEEILPLCERLK